MKLIDVIKVYYNSKYVRTIEDLINLEKEVGKIFAILPDYALTISISRSKYRNQDAFIISYGIGFCRYNPISAVILNENLKYVITEPYEKAEPIVKEIYNEAEEIRKLLFTPSPFKFSFGSFEEYNSYLRSIYKNYSLIFSVEDREKGTLKLLGSASVNVSSDLIEYIVMNEELNKRGLLRVVIDYGENFFKVIGVGEGNKVYEYSYGKSSGNYLVDEIGKLAYNGKIHDIIYPTVERLGYFISIVFPKYLDFLYNAISRLSKVIE